MQTWEYKVVTIAVSTDLWSGTVSDHSEYFTKGLNELGAEGWELVSSFDTNRHQGATQQIVFVLKRPTSAAPYR